MLAAQLGHRVGDAREVQADIGHGDILDPGLGSEMISR
jgi:hypothetical protein